MLKCRFCVFKCCVLALITPELFSSSTRMAMSMYLLPCKSATASENSPQDSNFPDAKYRLTGGAHLRIQKRIRKRYTRSLWIASVWNGCNLWCHCDKSYSIPVDGMCIVHSHTIHMNEYVYLRTKMYSEENWRMTNGLKEQYKSIDGHEQKSPLLWRTDKQGRMWCWFFYTNCNFPGWL